ncbi:MAG: 2-hydroxyacyl-CoA dehydratase family protein [Oscillospiraceae bacterium]|nr:2-hydroxyacyl-CoA dehydratase family protein [Oscillospiraceae bacterium]
MEACARRGENGKKLIFAAGPVPAELIYALDGIPLSLDLLVSRVSQDETLTAALIDSAELRANSTLCAMNKAVTGMLVSERLGLTPDAFVTLPIPCDSARTACKELARFIKAPVFNFDIPIRRNAKSVAYVETQLGGLVRFLETVFGKRLEDGALAHRLRLYNHSEALLARCVRLRAAAPCPASSHTALLNELMNAFGPTEEMVRLLGDELALCETRIAAGFSPCPGGEKHRVLLMHNFRRESLALTAWLEQAYGAATVLDGFCFGRREAFDKPADRHASFTVMARRLATGAAAHGSGVSGEALIAAAEALIPEFRPDVFVLLGSRGCRHIWGAAKLISDALTERFGFPMLLADIDNTDSRYRSLPEIKRLLAEYMDSVVNRN